MSEIYETTAIALAAMRTCRQTASDVGGAYCVHSEVYIQSHHLTVCIDRIAGLLTGDKEYFWEKHHCTPESGIDHMPWRDLVKKPTK